MLNIRLSSLGMDEVNNMFQWQDNIKILGVNGGPGGQVFIFFRNRLGVVGWREVWGSADGISNICSLAGAAQMSGSTVRLWISNEGLIGAIQTI
jgi:hypothetical protein